MDLVIFCPTRGRPQAAREALASFKETKTREGTWLYLVVDDDDPALPEYQAPDLSAHVIVFPAPGDMVKALNNAARWAIGEIIGIRWLGFIGDDHRFRTPGWDATFVSILEERHGGFIYGNDGFWLEGQIPTQIVISAEIVKALNWMGLPTCKHLYIDNAWRVLGDGVGRLFYTPDVLIEHLHPATGKVGWDEGHRRVNTTEMYSRDGSAFGEWLANQAPADIEKVAEALG